MPVPLQLPRATSNAVFDAQHTRSYSYDMATTINMMVQASTVCGHDDIGLMAKGNMSESANDIVGLRKST